MKISSKRKIYEDLPFSSGNSLVLVGNSYRLNQAHFSTYCYFKTFLKSYTAKSEIQGFTEKKSVMRVLLT